MAINRLQFGGLLNPKESFGWEEYGQPGPKITTPSLLGAGVLGDVAGKKGKIRRGNEIYCPAGTQPNASNTACVPIRKTTTTTPTTTKTTTTDTNTTCTQRGLVSDGLGGCKRPDGTTDGPITTQDGCPQGWSRDQWGNCHPTPITTSEEAKNLFDQRWEGKGPANIFTVAPPRVDPRTGQTISATGISMADAAKNYGLTPEESYRVTYSPYGAEERGQAAARGTWNPLSDPADLAARQTENLAAQGILSQSAFTPVQPWQETPAAAPLSTQDFLAQYSRPPKTVDQGILGLEAEREEVIDEVLARRRAEEFSGILPPPAPSVDQFEDVRKRQEQRERAEEFITPPRVDVDEFSDYQQQETQRRTEDIEEARERSDNIQKSQTAEKESKKANKKSSVAQKKANVAKGAAARSGTAASKAKAQKAVNEAHSAMMAATTAGVKSINARAKVDKTVKRATFRYTPEVKGGRGFVGGF
jgi:hypothetical protein